MLVPIHLIIAPELGSWDHELLLSWVLSDSHVGTNVSICMLPEAYQTTRTYLGGIRVAYSGVFSTSERGLLEADLEY